MTRWDSQQALRAFGFATLVLVLAWLVTAATDEGGVAWAERAARTLPLVPACAAAGTWLGEARSWARGDARALSALGRSPRALSAPAVLGAAAAAWLAAAAIGLSTGVDVEGFFPRVRAESVLVPEDDGTFLDEASGYRIEADGSLLPPPASASVISRASSTQVPPNGREAAALCTALSGLALPLLLARGTRGSRSLKAGVVAAAVAASIFVFQAAAARVVGALTAVVPQAALLAFALALVTKGWPPAGLDARGGHGVA